MPTSDERSAARLDELIVETRLLLEANRVLQERLRARRLWRTAGVTLAAMLGVYAWSLHALLAENVSLLRANTELVQSGNALLRATNTRQQEMQSALKQMRPPARLNRTQSPRRGQDDCSEGAGGCDSPTYWVPGFPGPRVSTKRTVLRPQG
jgi:hypothetical protein